MERVLPDDATMRSLLALTLATDLVVEDGELEAVVPDPSAKYGYRFHPVAGEHLDELEERGWITLFVGRDGLQ